MQPTWPAASDQTSAATQADPSGYLSERTIAAPCTSPGGAIGVLRISGSEALRIGAALTGRAIRREDDRRALFSKLRQESGQVLDEAVVTPYFGPRSYTGEDSVEIAVHGSPRVMERVLDAVFSLGARLALPGEFSFRAVKNGKMSLSQAEAVRELVAAENDFALELALEKLSGSQHRLVAGIRDQLMQLCVLSELGIDFADQDVDEVSLPRLKERLDSLRGMLTELVGSFDRGSRLADGVPVTIFGLPNAGKSSFFNSLLGEDRSIVSQIAGTTRDVVRERLNLRSAGKTVTLRLSDTAGLRAGADQIETIGMERTLKSAVESDLLVVVVDGAEPGWENLLPYLSRIDLGSKECLMVLSKADLMTPAERARLTEEVRTRFGSDGFWISSVTHEGVVRVAEALAAAAIRKIGRGSEEVVLTRVEHVRAVEGAMRCLDRARDASDLVLFATDVRHGMSELGPLIGETLPDDILGKIFSDFCIGK
jgi:tRNA modification GTPase